MLDIHISWALFYQATLFQSKFYISVSSFVSRPRQHTVVYESEQENAGESANQRDKVW